MTTAQQEIPQSIDLVAIDLDGTLLTPEGVLTERNASAMRRARAVGTHIILATGKSRASARRIIAQLELHVPGVFTQGTTIYDARGKVWHETTLARETAEDLLRFTGERGLPTLAYAGERLLMPADSKYRRQMHEQYHEPLPDIAPKLAAELDRVTINKLVVIDPVDVGLVRQALESLCAGAAHVTQAVSHFIEVLPPGASKGAGLRWLLEQMDVRPARVMAIGDGENDIEMLQMVGLGVAMGNAHPRLKAVARQVTGSNAGSGVAQAIERFVLKDG